MKLSLIRYSAGRETTLGLLFLDGKFQCYTLEDEKRNIKVAGETRIPSGRYEVTLRKEMSPKTESYRNRFYWFKWHLMLKDVPNFNYVYIHIGNTDDDTDGCILVGNNTNNNTLIEGAISNSTKAFEFLYKEVTHAMQRGEKVLIDVLDEETITKRM